MPAMRRILCPTDLSDLAPGALEQAVALARLHGAEIELAHVHEPLLPGPSGPATYPPWAALDPAMQGRLRAALEALAAPATAVGVVVRLGVYEGRVVAKIVERARTWPADLVVMGTHGRGGFERWVLGSVAEKVLRRAPCPVLTVPPPADGRGATTAPFRRVLCPVDFSGPSLAAVRHAVLLAGPPHAELTLVHVLEWPVEETPAARLAGFDVPEFRRHLEKDARERLHGLADASPREGLHLREEIRGGRPWREILSLAEGIDADLVVMGVRGRGAIDLALFGSTTQQVVRGARCPVLVVHANEEGAAEAAP
jgi:nucleotide-binding universal stress UspA family protein